MEDIIRNELETIISNPPTGRLELSRWVDNMDLSGIKKSFETENSQWEAHLKTAKDGDVLPLLSIHRGKDLLPKFVAHIKIRSKNDFLRKVMQTNDQDFIDALRNNLPKLNISEQ